MTARAVVAIVPAAGKSERFGTMKLLADVGGEPLIARTIRALLDAGINRVIVVCAPTPFGSVALFDDPRVELATNPSPSRGMFSTIQSGLALAGSESDVVVILPADMPFVRSETVAAVINECARTGHPVAAAYKGKNGHPVALPAQVLVALVGADANRSLKDALIRLNAPPAPFEVDDAGVVRDVDTREDLRQSH